MCPGRQRRGRSGTCLDCLGCLLKLAGVPRQERDTSTTAAGVFSARGVEKHEGERHGHARWSCLCPRCEGGTREERDAMTTLVAVGSATGCLSAPSLGSLPFTLPLSKVPSCFPSRPFFLHPLAPFVPCPSIMCPFFATPSRSPRSPHPPGLQFLTISTTIPSSIFLVSHNCYTTRTGPFTLAGPPGGYLTKPTDRGPRRAACGNDTKDAGGRQVGGVCNASRLGSLIYIRTAVSYQRLEL